MRNFETERQRKIETLMALVNGNLKPSDVQPNFLLKVNQNSNEYFINGRSVDEDTFNKRLETEPAICNFKTIGRIDDTAEYYY